ncbi:MAG: efflux RND transporter periplasmic adaptor subunit [Chitinophagales bacterium]|nr:efflux RND transporter periplasmic adaptor subunit [Chitinophagales bacterium]MDW8418342.1 efflux RND transporter periplasmic adaptor subunit [Chitinophagales bacterium]
MKNIICVVLVAVVVAGCSESEIDKKKRELNNARKQVKLLNEKIAKLEHEIAKLDTTYLPQVKPKLVQVQPLIREDFRHYIEAQGIVDAEENVLVLPQQPGIVTAIYVKEGDRVSKGQVLGITETTASLEAAIATLQTQYELAKTAFEKQERLWNQKIGSEIQYLSAKTQKEALEKQIAVQRTQLQMTKFISPINGVVDQVNLKVGDMAVGSQLMPGIRVINHAKLTVKAKLADSDFGKVKPGDAVEIEFPDINKTITAKVSHVTKTIDPRSRTFTVEVKLPNPGGEYAANMVAKVKINDLTLNDALVVPTNIIQKSEEGYYVMTAEQKNGSATARKNLIEKSVEYNGRTVIARGLSEGQQIIVNGYTDVVDGQKITF